MFYVVLKKAKKRENLWRRPARVKANARYRAAFHSCI